MAGPGGGPPRRSHTKSRKGCENCKRRHIRCDENFPQCRNCTKHKVRCPYNDVPVPDERSATPDKPDLMWNPRIEASIQHWQQTGIFPFPGLGIYPAPDPQAYTVEELRLIYHVSAICDEMSAMDANGFTLWTRQIPTVLRIGATNVHVMHALIAFAATHIAFLTDCPLVGNMAYEHRGIAFNGLQEAIGNFSRSNSDAVLAASLVLSWQATDWKSWTQLMQGTSSVIDAMEGWKHESQFGDFIAESSTFPTAPPSPRPDHKPSQPRKEDLDAFQRMITQLSKVEAHLKQNKEDTKLIQQLASFLKGARKVSPIQSISDQFDRLQPLRTWLFWLPVMCLKQNGTSPSALVILAHYYTAAMLMERLFPEIGAAYFGSLSIGPVEEIARRLLSINVSGSMEGDAQTPLSLMEFPIDTVTEFRSRMGWLQPARTHSFPQFDSPNFYMSEPFQGTPPPCTSSYVPYGGHPAFSWSTEDLSSIAPEPEHGTSAASPLSLSSPYPSQQYLSIPSPAYGGFSSASSTCGEGSVTYSDNEDFSLYDAGMGSYVQYGSAEASSFGVGTPLALTPSASTGHLPLDFSRAPSPFLQHDNLQALQARSTTPLSVSAPSPVFMTQPAFLQHHRHNSSISSAPSLYTQDDEASRPFH